MDLHESAHQKIDEGLLELLDVFSEYQRIRESSNALLREAFFDLSVARRSAGYQWISADMYSGRAQAITTVDINPLTDTINIVRKHRQEQCADEVQQDGPSEGLRRRHQASDSRTSTDGEKDEKVNSDKDEKTAIELGSSSPSRVRSDDPLLWFGMLVPPALKKAQGGFVDALDQLVRLAQLKRQLEAKQNTLQLMLDKTHSTSDID
ncbi:hypothetical protein H4R24_001033 [Coemansia sp. RSA 988]|nr:hypothetical protein H4R24_001033 [Coemansia sp. RSA 988]